MKIVYNSVVLGFSILWFAVLFNELANTFIFERSLDDSSKGLPIQSETLKLAKEDPKYSESQSKASHKRSKIISTEISRFAWMGMVSLCILTEIFKTHLISILNSIISVIPIFKNNIYIKEMYFVSLIVSMFIFSLVGWSFPKLTLKKHSLDIPPIIIYLGLFILVFPLLYVTISKLFNYYGYKFIIACYIAYYVKAISEFVTLDDVNLTKMKKVDISIFSEEVKKYLIEKHLERRVYEEIKKSENINAALVGWGHFERIEIYGEYSTLNMPEFEAILLHEIGHSQDYSLFKKLGVLFAIKFTELVILLALYIKISKYFTDQNISQISTFLLLYLVYLIFINRWLMMFHKLTSQMAEKNADMVAKSHSYGKNLASVLYQITIKANTNLNATFFYNSLKSYHPTIFERIEVLNKE